MPVSQSEFDKVWGTYPTAVVRTRDRWKTITGVEVQVQGIRGGCTSCRRDWRSTVWYKLFVDVTNIRTEGAGLPTVFILEPADGDIVHVNVFHPKACAQLGQDLPYLCWGGENEGAWRNLPANDKTLYSVLSDASRVLSAQNFGSPARTCCPNWTKRY